MSRVKDLTDQYFGRLHVIERAENSKDGRARWLCECECNNRKIILGKHLVSGKIQSCGCLQKESITKHGMCGTRIYSIYRGMKDRCYNQNMSEYPNYGGRGITICDEWLNDPSAFFKWSLDNGYSDDLTIDRKDNDGNYCPENCQWSTFVEQQNNKSNNTYLTKDGETHTVAEWSRILGINPSTISTRLFKGCNDEEALRVEKKVNQYV